MMRHSRLLTTAVQRGGVKKAPNAQSFFTSSKAKKMLVSGTIALYGAKKFFSQDNVHFPLPYSPSYCMSFNIMGNVLDNCFNNTNEKDYFVRCVEQAFEQFYVDYDSLAFFHRILQAGYYADKKNYSKLKKGILLLEQQSVVEALAVFDDVFLNDLPTRDHYLAMKGILYVSLGDDESARECFRQSELFLKKIAQMRQDSDQKIMEADRDVTTQEKSGYYIKLKNTDEEIQIKPELLGELRQIISKYNASGTQSSLKINQGRHRLDNRNKIVIIRIWSASTERREVGHVSIQTAEEYLSFWPNEQIVSMQGTVIKPSGKRHSELLEDIFLLERRFPDKRIILHSLDEEKINQFIRAFKKDENVSWILWGSSILRGGKDYNCTSAAYEALLEGGIGKLASRHLTDIYYSASQSSIFAAFAAGLAFLVWTVIQTFTGRIPYSEIPRNDNKGISWWIHELHPLLRRELMMRQFHYFGVKGGYALMATIFLGFVFTGTTAFSTLSAMCATPFSIELLATRAEEVERERHIQTYASMFTNNNQTKKIADQQSPSTNIEMLC